VREDRLLLELEFLELVGLEHLAGSCCALDMQTAGSVRFIPLLYIFQPPSTAARPTAYGTHSDFIMAVPTISSAEGMYTPCTYCVLNMPSDDMLGSVDSC
jgi:hypothetical protein